MIGGIRHLDWIRSHILGVNSVQTTLATGHTVSYMYIWKNVNKSYKKSTEATAKKIQKIDKKITQDLQIDDRVDTTAKKDAFITLKDHKPNFENNPSCRIINPTKSEIGKVSKRILDRINAKVTVATQANQWKSTSSVIEWYKNITVTNEHRFICFDVVDFYPSISEELLNSALDFASAYDNITNEERNVIIQAKNSLLIYNSQQWQKKNSSFDVTMGSFDGAETCELVGCFLLSQLRSICGETVGLYRDDGIMITDKSPKEAERMKKSICRLFKENGLSVTIEVNKKVVNFLDLTLNLNDHSFSPYTKPNSTIQYVNFNSNHPPIIPKNLPKSINKRLSSLSSCKEVFDRAAPVYQEALHASGYKHKLSYDPSCNTRRRGKNNNRKRDILWFNPPFRKNVATNIGKKFFTLLDRCFPQGTRLHRLFNRNTVKLSYSCMPNVKNAVLTNNKKVINASSNSNAGTSARADDCNCRIKSSCPLDGKCQQSGVVYQAKVTRLDNNSSETYVGLTENSFKIRYRNHTASFRNKVARNSTELSKHVWSLKERGLSFNISWRILSHARPYNSASKRCNLCLSEKFFIICKPHYCTLNKRNELVSSCRHRAKALQRYN